MVILPPMRPEQYLVGINMQIRVKENTAQFGKCGCGRSPTGYCMGWHGLNEQQLKEAQEKYQAQQLDNK
jgi:ABC-type phosphate transport system ATPase subunit